MIRKAMDRRVRYGLCLALALIAGPAAAEPSIEAVRWGGLQVGGFVASVRGDSLLDLRASGVFVNRVTPEFDTQAGGVIVNWQMQRGALVAGVELAYSAGDISGTQRDRLARNNVGEVSIGRMAQIGVRAGWAVGRFLPYLAVGVARAEVDSVYRATRGPFVGSSVSDSKHHDAITFGFGLDWKVHPHVVVGLDYQRIDFDSGLHVGSNNVGRPPRDFARTVDAAVDVVRLRLTWHLAH